MDVKSILYADFILVEAEKLSMADEFMKYEPKTDKEKIAQNLIAEAIKKRVKNFYRPNCDPSFNKDSNKIQFVYGERPAIGKSYNWWKDVAKSYNPSRNSRLGTKLEYFAFLGVLIKKLIEEGIPIEWAWYVVCYDSGKIGHYCNSQNAKREFEITGSRKTCGFCDLANVYKLLGEEYNGFYMASGCYSEISYYEPLSNFFYEENCQEKLNYSVGWIVFD